MMKLLLKWKNYWIKKVLNEMKKVIRLTETDLVNIVKKVLKEEKIKNKIFLSEAFLDKAKIIVSRLNKNKQTTNQPQPTDPENVEKSLSEFAAKMKSANLGTYRGQLQTIVEPLGSLYMRLEDLNAEDCRKGRKPGTLAAQRMEPVKNQIYDIFQRVYVDMKNELVSNNLLTQQEAASFTIDDAIEMLYARYNQQKGFLKNIAKSIVKVAGGGYISAQMLTIISDGIRKKFGERTGGLANSVMTDFIGGLFSVMADDSLGDCVPQTASSSQEASIRQGL